MRATIVKQGFAVIIVVAFLYIAHKFRNPVITTLKVVGCENCVREDKLSLKGPEGEAPAAGQFLTIKKNKSTKIWKKFERIYFAQFNQPWNGPHTYSSRPKYVLKLKDCIFGLYKSFK